MLKPLFEAWELNFLKLANKYVVLKDCGENRQLLKSGQGILVPQTFDIECNFFVYSLDCVYILSNKVNEDDKTKQRCCIAFYSSLSFRQSLKKIEKTGQTHKFIPCS